MGCGGSTTAKGQSGLGKESNDINVTDVTDLDFDYDLNPPQNQHLSNNKSVNHHNKQNLQRKEGLGNPRPVIKTVKKDDLVVDSLEDETAIPPPKPSTQKKEDIIKDSDDLKRIDEHVAKTPSSACASVPELVAYLTKPATSSLQKLRAFHEWITHNIRYDTDGFFTGSYKTKGTDSQSVFRTRSSVCQGYSELFAEMCRCVHIPVKIIQGFAKGYGYNPEVPFDLNKDTNHAWNAVVLNGEWRLIDCTWDAGTVSEDMKFSWAHRNVYFLADPENFIQTHFPYMNKNIASSQPWQFLKTPIDITTFSKALKIDEEAMEMGIIPVSHKEGVVLVNKEAEIIVERAGGPISEVTVSLCGKNDGNDYKNCVFIQRLNNNRIALTIRPSVVKTYTLNVFGRSGTQEKLCNWFQYIIKCTTVKYNVKPYPENFGIWGPKMDVEDFGFDKSISNQAIFVSENGELDITLPTTREVEVWSNMYGANGSKINDAVFLQYGVSSLMTSIRMPKDGNYKFELISKRPDGSCSVIFSYLIVCQKGLNPCLPFPTVYEFALKYKVTLHEPKCKTLPANTSVHFRFSSPLLASVIIGSKVYDKQQNSKGDVWEIDAETGGSGSDFGLFGNTDNSGQSDGIYLFEIV